MSENLTHAQLTGIITKINSSFGVQLNAEDFRSDAYSISSLQDMLVQKISDELNDEWTTDKAFHKLRVAISSLLSIDPNSLTLETELSALFPKDNRKKQMTALGDKLGFVLEVLKPNSVIYGIFIFLFFACIPFGIGMDWFLSGICLVIFGVIIFILGKAGNTFKMKTVGDLADHIAWKNYLKQKGHTQLAVEKDIKAKVMGLVS